MPNKKKAKKVQVGKTQQHPKVQVGKTQQHPKVHRKPAKAQKIAIKATKKAKKATTKVAKQAHKSTMPRKKSKDSDTTGIYEEATITCPGCGRITKVIKLAGVDTEGLICQRCAKGEIELEEMDF